MLSLLSQHSCCPPWSLQHLQTAKGTRGVCHRLGMSQAGNVTPRSLGSSSGALQVLWEEAPKESSDPTNLPLERDVPMNSGVLAPS